MNKKLLMMIAACMISIEAMPQNDSLYTVAVKHSEFFNRLDLTVSTGSTGVGLELATPVGSMFRLRGGFSFMPHLSQTLHFGIKVGERSEGQTEAEFNTQSQSRFEKLSGLLENFTGYSVDNQIDMRATATYYNFHVLADIYPIPRNKHWRLTTGVYIGNKQIGKAVNTTEDMPSLLAVGIYNNLHDRIVADGAISLGNVSMTVPQELADRIERYGRMSINIGEYAHDVYYEDDDFYVVDVPYWDDNLIDPETGLPGRFTEEGEIIYRHRKGDIQYHEGDSYRMVPDDDSMAKAWAYANRLKPYVGFGYDGALSKKDDRWQIGFDAGVMFWGGAPNVVTHDGTSLTNDVKNIRGRVGEYMDVIKKFEVFPVLNLRITRRL